MEIELNPAVSLLEETFNVLVAPVDMLVEALNSHLNLQRYKILFISGNYSRLLSRLDRNFTDLDIRRAFTSFQLMTILEENHHSFMIIEHDPMLYEDAKQMVEYVGQALKQTSREATHAALCACARSSLPDDGRASRPSILRLRRRERTYERASESARKSGHFGGVLMRWLWIREARLIAP
jgi:hypothetical protein